VNRELVAETRKEKLPKDERSFGFRAIVAVTDVRRFH
jgi:hypothetical protein